MIKSYVNGVPVAAVLVRAGHDNMLHLLPRSTVEPDQALLDLIFPGIEKMLEERKTVCCSSMDFCVHHANCDGIPKCHTAGTDSYMYIASI